MEEILNSFLEEAKRNNYIITVNVTVNGKIKSSDGRVIDIIDGFLKLDTSAKFYSSKELIRLESITSAIRI